MKLSLLSGISENATSSNNAIVWSQDVFRKVLASVRSFAPHSSLLWRTRSEGRRKRVTCPRSHSQQEACSELQCRLWSSLQLHLGSFPGRAHLPLWVTPSPPKSKEPASPFILPLISWQVCCFGSLESSPCPCPTICYVQGWRVLPKPDWGPSSSLLFFPPSLSPRHTCACGTHTQRPFISVSFLHMSSVSSVFWPHPLSVPCFVWSWTLLLGHSTHPSPAFWALSQ